jgi:transposase
MLSKPASIDSTKPRRVRGTTSGARSHADAAAGPQPIVLGLLPAATKQGSSRPRVFASEQPIEPSPRPKRSHVQERVPVTDSSSVSSKPCVGIDVSKDHLDIARSDQKATWRNPNNSAGIEKLVNELLAVTPQCIVVESTGGIERPLIAALLEAGLPVALVNPGNVRDLAKGLGILAKTDAIDAHLLARFAQLASPRLLEKRLEIQAELAALVTCRRQLVKTRTEQSNRRQTTSSKRALGAIDAVIATLDKQIAKLDQQIADQIDSNDQWKKLSKNLQTTPGVAQTAAATFVAQVPELGKLEHREMAALIGVAPFNRESGKWQGKRAIRGGREAVRSVLYMVAIAAMRCNPVIKTFADRLQAAGKPAKVVIVACMHKLLTLLNVMARENLEWNQLNLVKNA